MSVATSSELINVSLNIRRLRENKGWSVRELAKKLNTSHPTVVRWEQPIPNITLDSLENIADVFGVSIKSLFEEALGL